MASSLIQRALAMEGYPLAPFLSTPDLLHLSEASPWLLDYRHQITRLKLIQRSSSLPPDSHRLHRLLWTTRQVISLRVATPTALPFILHWVIQGRPLHLQHLELSSLDRDDSQTGDMAQALLSGHCSRLEKLDLSNSQITPQGFLPILEALQTACCPLLKFIDLSWNQGVVEGGDHLAAIMEAGAWSQLEKINLFNTWMESSAVQAIARALRRRCCPGLRSLILMSCKAGRGLTALGEALADGGCVDLEELVLSWNQGVEEAMCCPSPGPWRWGSVRA